MSAWVSAEEHTCCQAGLHPGCVSSLMNFVQLLSTLHAVARLSKHVCCVTEGLVIVRDYRSGSRFKEMELLFRGQKYQRRKEGLNHSPARSMSKERKAASFTGQKYE